MSRKLILAFLFVLVHLGEASPVLINAVAGKVGDQLITVQDAYFYRSLERLRAGLRPVVLVETDKALKTTIQKTMFEQMIIQEAKAVGFKDSELKDANQLVRRLKESGQEKDWMLLLKSFAMSEAEGLRKFQQSLLAEQFLKKKIESLSPVVTDYEVEQYITNYPERAKKLGDKNRQFITDALKKEKVDKGLQDYIDFLTEKYSATLLFS